MNIDRHYHSYCDRYSICNDWNELFFLFFFFIMCDSRSSFFCIVKVKSTSPLWNLTCHRDILTCATPDLGSFSPSVMIRCPLCSRYWWSRCLSARACDTVSQHGSPFALRWCKNMCNEWKESCAVWTGLFTINGNGVTWVGGERLCAQPRMQPHACFPADLYPRYAAPDEMMKWKCSVFCLFLLYSSLNDRKQQPNM